MNKKHSGIWFQNKSQSDHRPKTLNGSLAQHENIVGVLVDFPWAMIEPEQGHYDFSLIKAYRDWGKTNEKIMGGFFMDRNFRATNDENDAIPTWVRKQGLSVEFPNGKGSIATVWNPDLVAMKINALQAIANEFGDDPWFKAIFLQETALGGITPQNMHGFTREGYTEQLMRIHDEVSPTLGDMMMVHFIHFAIANPVAETLHKFGEQLTRLGNVGWGRPDMPPWDKTHTDVYDVWPLFADKVFTFGGGDTSQLQYPGNGYYSDFDELLQMMYQHQRGMGLHAMTLNPWFRSKASERAGLTSLDLNPDYQAACKRFLDSNPKMNPWPPSGKPIKPPEKTTAIEIDIRAPEGVNVVVNVL